MNLYYGSGIIPIIKVNNEYYFILFKSSIRKKNNENLIEDSGGKFEGENIKISAIRELKEESSLLFDLENFKKHQDIKNLYKVLKTFSLEIEGWDDDKYLSYFIYLGSNFDLSELKENFKSNMRKFWKNGFSVYTESKDIIFIPINNIKDLTLESQKIIDNNNDVHLIFVRTVKIFIKLQKEYDLLKFIKKITQYPIILNKNIIKEYNVDKSKINDLISYN
jgi:hypothetical protein